MEPVIFIQRSRLGRSIFMLGSEHLDVTAFNFGMKSAQKFSLKSISTDYQVIAHRYWFLILVPFVMAAACIGLSYAILSQDAIPHGPVFHVGIFLAAFIIATFRGVPRVEHIVFLDHWKKPLFYIVREAAQAEACNAFVDDLIDRIEEIETGIPRTASPPVTLRGSISVRYGQTVASSQMQVRSYHYWILAICSGALSAGYPIAAETVAALKQGMFPVVILGTFGGLLFGVFSFVAKERMRVLSLAGVALALVAPLFY
jgi:hypothetical protein